MNEPPLLGVSLEVRQQIAATLADIETREGVRILLAVESGSRAWGFPSQDSDYDIRFIYTRPVTDYLSIFPPRDVIERPIEGDIDIGGWDLRKAIGLLVRSNAVALEWLASPIVYRADSNAVRDLVELGAATANIADLEYHYDRLARGRWPGNSDEMRVKSLCYAIRPAFVLKWLRAFGRPPPMDLPALLADLNVSGALGQAVQSLIERKAAGHESDHIDPDPAIATFLDSALAMRAPRPIAGDRTQSIDSANRLFLRLIGSSGVASPFPGWPPPADEPR